MTANRFRSVWIAIGLMLLAGAPVVAQEAVAPQTLGELFIKLAQLQQANIFVARQMSETQLRAAAVLQAPIDDGSVSDAVQKQIAETFISNALTLASVTLSPVATQQVATGDAMKRLLRQNLVSLEAARPSAAGNAALAEALEKYTALQLQSQDLVVALENGWSRYGEVIRTAQVAGMLDPGAFDPIDKSWRLLSPEVSAAPSATDGGMQLKEIPSLGGGAADIPAEIAASETPQPASTAEVPPLVALAPEEQAALAPFDASDAVEVSTLADGSLRVGDWTVAQFGGITTATSGNIDPATTSLISAMTIDCRPNGTLQYVVSAGSDYSRFRIYSNDSDFRTVQASWNIISGQDALQTSDTLRAAFDWAEEDKDAKRVITLSAADADAVVAHFSPRGYMQARGRVLYACAPWKPKDPTIETSLELRDPADDASATTATAETPVAQPAPATTTAEAAPPVAPADTAAAQPALAPVPHTRPQTAPTNQPVQLIPAN